MNSRLQSLINRGYDVNEVLSLAYYTEEELEYASKCAFNHISNGCVSVENPNAIFIGGQPGSGKTVVSMNLKNKMENAIEINIDNYRMYHPRYLEMEKCIKRHWEGRVETENDTPGNDIADFTHLFAGAMSDKMIEMGRLNRYNLLLEWGMREPKGPLACMNNTKSEGYNNVVLFVVAHKDISYEACKLRASLYKNSKHIIRKVPQSFHDYCVETLPDSIDVIHSVGSEQGVIDHMALITRSCNDVLWNDNSLEKPGDVFSDYVNNKNDINVSNDINFAMRSNFMESIGLETNNNYSRT